MIQRLKGSWPLKIVALGFALATYFYIHGEIERADADKAQDSSYRLIKLTAKTLPVKVRLATDSPDGYRIVMDKVSANPANIIVVGPEVLLQEASAAETALIDMSQSTQSLTRLIPLESVAGIHLAGDAYRVEVTVPLEKVETETP